MKDLANRFPENPLLLPKDVAPSADGLQVICLLNPGVFTYRGKIWLLSSVDGVHFRRMWLIQGYLAREGWSVMELKIAG